MFESASSGPKDAAVHRTGQPDGLAREFSPLAGGSSAAGMSEQPWTIESIRDALGNPVLGQRFLSEINRAPAHELLSVFARWERIAKDTIVAVRCGRELAAAEARGEEPAGEWVDATDRVLADTERIRTRGAA